MAISSPGSRPVVSMARTSSSSASAAVAISGANPPSSPTPVANPLSCNRFRSAWKTSAPHRRASENDAAPTGASMNSCGSNAFCACAPPFTTFIRGTGRTCEFGPPR